MRSDETQLVVTCEHARHFVPSAYTGLFRGAARLLTSHRGWDPGALPIARALARSLRAPLFEGRTTRLLVDLNRSPDNPRVFSRFSRALPRSERAELLERYHQPHWKRVRECIEAHAGPTIHIAVHSFTPIWQGRPRHFGVGLLYDPKRRRELELAIALQVFLQCRTARNEVRRNAPYRGDSDGLTTAMRRIYPARRYLGIEIELNQATLETPPARRAVASRLTHGLREVLGC